MHMMERMPWVERQVESPMVVPAPLAFFGVLVAYMLGMMIGIMMGKKAMLVTGGHGKHMKMKHHHHHALGDGPCGKKHGHGHHESRERRDESGERRSLGWDAPEGDAPQADQAAPGATPGESRNEGE